MILVLIQAATHSLNIGILWQICLLPTVMLCIICLLSLPSFLRLRPSHHRHQKLSLHHRQCPCLCHHDIQHLDVGIELPLASDDALPVKRCVATRVGLRLHLLPRAARLVAPGVHYAHVLRNLQNPCLHPIFRP